MQQISPCVPVSRSGWALRAAVLLAFAGSPAAAQISLSTAVNLALKNNPRVKIAESDLARAKAVLTESKEVYIPAVSANGGVGTETGAPLSAPVVFSIGAQSLVFSFSQPDYIRAARSGLHAAQMALDAVRTDISEDTVNTYLGLESAERREAVHTEALAIATRLINIVGERYAAGVDPHIELTRAKRTAAQLNLQALQVDDEIAAAQEHLAALTGLPPTGWKTVPESVPALPPLGTLTGTPLEDPNHFMGMSAAFSTAVSRRYTAHGDERTLLRPQLAFQANYSRLEDAFTTYDQYYPGFPGIPGHPNSFNSLSVGVQLTVPILDMVRRAKARESAADAVHALLDARVQQAGFIEGREKLRHSAVELEARSTLLALDHDLSQDELDAVLLRLRTVSGEAGGVQASPKDEGNARLAERQRTLEMLSAELQLQQTEVSLMRQEGSLAHYLELTLPRSTGASAVAVPAVTTPSPVSGPPLPPTVGAEPAAAVPGGGTVPVGAAPPPSPTTGAAPSVLPSSPVSTPTPAAPATSPSPNPHR